MKRYFVRSIIEDKETGITVEKIVGKEHTVIFRETIVGGNTKRKEEYPDFDRTGDFRYFCKGYKNIGSARRFMNEQKEWYQKRDRYSTRHEVVCFDD
jgi:hypothetical protein